MAVDHRIIRNTENFRGLDLRSSDSSRSSEFSSGMKNAMYRVSGAINKRKGFKTLYNTNSLKGMTNFKNISKDGSVSDELIYVEENNVKKLVSFDVNTYKTTQGIQDSFKVSFNNVEGTTYNFKITSEGGADTYYDNNFDSTSTTLIDMFSDISFRSNFTSPELSSSVIRWEDMELSDIEILTYSTWNSTSNTSQHGSVERFIENPLYIIIPIQHVNVTAFEAIRQDSSLVSVTDEKENFWEYYSDPISKNMYKLLNAIGWQNNYLLSTYRPIDVNLSYLNISPSQTAGKTKYNFNGNISEATHIYIKLTTSRVFRESNMTSIKSLAYKEGHDDRFLEIDDMLDIYIPKLPNNDFAKFRLYAMMTQNVDQQKNSFGYYRNNPNVYFIKEEFAPNTNIEVSGDVAYWQKVAVLTLQNWVDLALEFANATQIETIENNTIVSNLTKEVDTDFIALFQNATPASLFAGSKRVANMVFEPSNSAYNGESISILNTFTNIQVPATASSIDKFTFTTGNINETVGQLDWTFSQYNNPSYKNIDFANLNNLLYMADGVNELKKYDGESVYSAGLPNCDDKKFTITNQSASTGLPNAQGQNSPTQADIDAASIHINKAGEVKTIDADLSVAETEVFLMPNHKYVFEFVSTKRIDVYIEMDTKPTIQTATLPRKHNNLVTNVAINVHPTHRYYIKSENEWYEITTNTSGSGTSQVITDYSWSLITDSARKKGKPVGVQIIYMGTWGQPSSNATRNLSGRGLKAFIETDGDGGFKTRGVYSEKYEENGEIKTRYYGGSGYKGYSELSSSYQNWSDIIASVVTGDNDAVTASGTHISTRDFYEYQSWLTDPNAYGVDNYNEGTSINRYDTYVYHDDAVVGRMTIQEATPMESLKTFEYIVTYEYSDAKGNVISSQECDPIKVEVAANTKNTISWSSISDLSDRDITGTFSATWKSSNGIDDSIMLPTKPTTSNTNPLTEKNYTVQELNLLKIENEKRMRIVIYRSKGYSPKDGEIVGQYYKILDVPYTNLYTTVTDTIKDDDINTFFNYVYPVKRKDPPPKGKFLTVYKNCLVVSGQLDNVNNVQYSLPKNFLTGEIGSEYFPSDDNAIVIESNFGSSITAIAALKDAMFVFHKDSIYAVVGNINELELPTTDLVTKEGGVGCVSHASIEEYKGGLAFLSDTGIYSISSRGLEEISAPIKSLFLDKNFKKEKATTFNWVDKNLLITCIPDYVTISDPEYPLDATENTYVSKNSLIVVYDYFKDAWLQWDTIEFTSGITLSNDIIYFGQLTKTGNKLCTITNNNDRYDYNDDGAPINFSYETNWESLGEPTVPKKFLRLKIHSFDTDLQHESLDFKLRVEIEKDFIKSYLGEIEFDFGKSAGDGWGNFQWGLSTWGSETAKYLKSKMPTGKAKSLKLNFKNENNNENVLITNYEMEIASPYSTEIKS